MYVREHPCWKHQPKSLTFSEFFVRARSERFIVRICEYDVGNIHFGSGSEAGRSEKKDGSGGPSGVVLIGIVTVRRCEYCV